MKASNGYGAAASTKRDRRATTRDHGIAPRVSDLMSRGVATVGPTDSLAFAAQLMAWFSVRHLPVVREGTLVGVLSERDVLAARGAGDASWVGCVDDMMSGPAEVVAPDDDLADAAKRMVCKRIGCLPVVHAGELVGMLTRSDVVAYVAHGAKAPGYGRIVGDLMTTAVVTARADDPVLDVIATMNRHGVRHVPVVDGGDHVIGIVSDRDVRVVVGEVENDRDRASARIAATRARDVMTEGPRTVRSDDTIELVTEIFVRDRFGAVPVVDDEERLVGMLSYLDILRGRPRHLVSR